MECAGGLAPAQKVGESKEQILHQSPSEGIKLRDTLNSDFRSSELGENKLLVFGASTQLVAIAGPRKPVWGALTDPGAPR